MLNQTGTLIRGTEGQFNTAANCGGRIAAWRGNLMTDVNDATGFGGGNAKQSLDGLYGVRGTASGYLTHGTNADQPGFPFDLNSSGHASLTLTASTISGCTLSFWAYFSQVALGVDVHNNATIAFSFESNGPVNTVWNTTG